MKIFILQNSVVSFDLDASLIFQPTKYQLVLITNDFCANIIRTKKQKKYYRKIIIINSFSEDEITSIIHTELSKHDRFNIITNSEETMPLCGKLRQHFKLDQEDYSRFYNKHEMKKRLLRNRNIKLPSHIIFDHNQFTQNKPDYLDQITHQLSFPMFAKPVALYSSVGLKKIHSIKELTVWAESRQPNDYYELDEFIDGTMYHCDSYIKNHQILFTFVAKNSRPCYDFTIGKMKGTIVLPYNHPDSLLLSNFTEKVLHDLGLPEAGVTHLECIKKATGEIVFIEIAHRSPGCLIPKMYQHAANIDTIASHFLLQIDPNYYPKPKMKEYAAWACYPKKPGIIKKLHPLPQGLDSHIELNWQYQEGDTINSFSQFGRDYTGTIFMTNKSFPALHTEFQIINDNNLCEIISVNHQPAADAEASCL